MQGKIKKLSLAIGVLLVILGISIYPYSLSHDKIKMLYSNESSQYATLMGDGAVIHYQDTKIQSGPTLILVHGSNMSSYAWAAWTDLLKDKMRIISIDMPAHGITGRIPSDDYSMASMVRAVQTVAEYLGLSQFYLGGNSMGGNVTWRYALEFPHQLKGMILVDAAGHPRENNAFNVFDLAKLPLIRDISKQPVPKFLIAAGLRDAVFDEAVITDEMIERNYDFSRREGTQEANALRFKGKNTGEWYKRLGEITVPTLILWGEHDHFIPAEDATRFHESLPNSQLVIYPNMAHIPMIEDPVTTARDVEKFINAQEKAAIN